MRILFVDDEPAVLKFLSQIAEFEKFIDYTCVENSEMALTEVLRQPFDLITLDILMPGLTGLEIVSLLRNLNPHAVIAILSAHIPDSVSEEISGCVDVMLWKPVNVGVLRSLLQGAHKVKQGMQEVRKLENLQLEEI